jgi:hypothetical protein
LKLINSLSPPSKYYKIDKNEKIGSSRAGFFIQSGAWRMVTKVSSVWGLQTGWLSRREDGFLVSATLEGAPVRYFSDNRIEVKEAFGRACRRTFFRKFLPWISPAPQELVLLSPARTNVFIEANLEEEFQDSAFRQPPGL